MLFHVVLLLSGLDRERLAQDDSVHSRQLLDQCLTLLNARVQDPVASVNDHTLVAIASLAAMEHDRGNMRALNMVRVLELELGGGDVPPTAISTSILCGSFGDGKSSRHPSSWRNELRLEPLTLDCCSISKA